MNIKEKLKKQGFDVSFVENYNPLSKKEMDFIKYNFGIKKIYYNVKNDKLTFVKLFGSKMEYGYNDSMPIEYCHL